MSEQAADEQVEMAAPAHAVWSLRHDFRRLPEYNPAVSQVDQTVAPGPDGGGAEYHFQLSTAAGLHPVVLRVTEAEPDRLVAAAMAGQMAARERFTVEAVDAEHSRARLTLWLDLPDGLAAETVAHLLANGQREIRGELDAMRAIVEGSEGSAEG